MKTIRVPLKETWVRSDYLACIKTADTYNMVERDYTKIVCSFCPREITSPAINVVEFGVKVACAPCFKARYRSRRQIYKVLSVPPDLNPQGSEEEDPLAVVEKQKSALDKAVELQNKNVTQIRESFSKVDPVSESTQD